MPTQIYDHHGYSTSHTPAHPSSAHPTAQALLDTLQAEAEKREMARYCNIPPDPRYVDIIAMDRVNRGVAASDVSLERRGHWIDRDSGNSRPHTKPGEFGVPAGKSLKMIGPYVDLRASTRRKSVSSKKIATNGKSTHKDLAELSRRLGSIDIESCDTKGLKSQKRHRDTHREVVGAKLTRRLSAPTPRSAISPAMVFRSHSAPVVPSVAPVAPPQAPAKASSRVPSRRNSIACPVDAPSVASRAEKHHAAQNTMSPIVPAMILQPCYVDVRAVYPMSPTSQPQDYFGGALDRRMSAASMIDAGQYINPNLYPQMTPSLMGPSANSRIRRWRAGMELEDELEDVPEEGTVCDFEPSSALVDDVGSSISKRAEDRVASPASRHPPPAVVRMDSAAACRPHSMSTAFADPAFRQAIVNSFPELRQSNGLQTISSKGPHPSRVSRSEWKRQEQIVLSK